MKRKQKCVARPWGASNYCEGCKRDGTKCPIRYKYRELRNTKKGKAYENLLNVGTNYDER